VADVDPLSPEAPLIFSAGPFAGTNFSNANRFSVGCKSPLTGGVKEANSGGTFAYAMGQLEISGITFTGACDDWQIIHISKDGDITFSDAKAYLGLGNFDCARKLHEVFGDKVSARPVRTGWRVSRIACRHSLFGHRQPALQAGSTWWRWCA
jgi:aldehyde:ferredoxin oxidoreductase